MLGLKQKLEPELKLELPNHPLKPHHACLSDDWSAEILDIPCLVMADAGSSNLPTTSCRPASSGAGSKSSSEIFFLSVLTDTTTHG